MIRDKKTGYQRNLNYDELVAREQREGASLPVSAHLQRSATAFVLSPFYSRLYEMEHQDQTAPVAAVHIEMPHQYLEAMRQAPVQAAAPAAPGPPGPAGPTGPVGMQGPQELQGLLLHRQPQFHNNPQLTIPITCNRKSTKCDSKLS